MMCLNFVMYQFFAVTIVSVTFTNYMKNISTKMYHPQKRC